MFFSHILISYVYVCGLSAVKQVEYSRNILPALSRRPS